jgi:SnoaL-like domain
MIHEETIREYFAGWNAHDATKLAPLFAKDGTYEDPVGRMAVHPWDLATVLWSIETVLPDFYLRGQLDCLRGGALHRGMDTSRHQFQTAETGHRSHQQGDDASRR